MNNETTTLYRPVGPKGLEFIVASGYREFPPRLPEQPIFYPVLNGNTLGKSHEIGMCLPAAQAT